MSVVRPKLPKDNFFQAPTEVMNHEDLSLKAKGLHCYIMSRPPAWTIYRKQLVKASDDGRHAVQSGLKELADAGYALLVRLKDKETNQWLGQRYLVRDVLERTWPKSEKIQIGEGEDREEKEVVFVTDEEQTSYGDDEDSDEIDEPTEAQITMPSPPKDPGERVSRSPGNPAAGNPRSRETRPHNNKEYSNIEYSNTSPYGEEAAPQKEPGEDTPQENKPSQQGSPEDPIVEPEQEEEEQEQLSPASAFPDDEEEQIQQWYGGHGPHPYTPGRVEEAFSYCANRNDKNGVCVRLLLRLFDDGSTDPSDIFGWVAKITQDIESLGGVEMTGKGPHLFVQSLLQLTNPPDPNKQRADFRPFENEVRKDGLVRNVLEYITASIESRKKQNVQEQQLAEQEQRQEDQKEAERALYNSLDEE